MDTTKTLDSVLNDEPLPEITDSPDPVVNLICGVKSGDTWLDTAIVREMTGEDEEFLADMDNRSSLTYPEYILALLQRTVVSIGNISVTQSPSVLNELIIGDRDLLYLSVVKATYGKSREFKVKCPHCSESNDLLIDLDDDFPIQGDRTQARDSIEVTLKNNKKYTFRRPNAEDSRRVARASKSVAQQNTIMISRCIKDLVGDTETWARKLAISDRSAIVNAIFDAKVGPSPQEVNAPCGHCGQDVRLALDWVSLLFG